MALRELLAKFDIDVDSSKLKKGDSAISGFAKKLEGFVSMVSGAVVVGAIKNFVDGMVDQASAIQDTSAQLGIQQHDLQQWQLAAKLSGAEASDLATSLKILQKNASDAAKNGASTGGMFKELGVSLRDSGGGMRDTTEILYDTGIAISKMQNPADRTRAALEVFGKAGTKLLPMFNEGEAGLNGLLAELDRLGGGLSDEAIEALGNQGDALDRMDVAFTSVKGKIAMVFIPILTKMTDFVSKTATAFTSGGDAATHLKAAVVALGIAGAAAGVRMLIPWLPTIVAFAALYLLIDDVMTALEGGDALSSGLVKEIQKLGGSDAAAPFRDMNKEIAKTPGFWNKVGVGFDQIALGIGRFFVDTLPEAASYAASDIGGFFGQLWYDIKEQAESVLTGMFGEGIVQSVQDIRTALIAVFNGDWSEARAAGERIAERILEGLGDIGEKIADKVGLSKILGSESEAKTAKGGTAENAQAEIAKIQAYYAKPVYHQGAPLPYAQGTQMRETAARTFNAPQAISIVINGDTSDPGTVKEGAAAGAKQGLREAYANLQKAPG